MKHEKSNKQNGFTLVELLVVISIISLVMTFAVPAFSNFVKNTNIRSSEGDLLTAFQFARAEAIRRGATISLDPIDDSVTTNEWGNGIVVWFDADGDGSLDIGEELRIVSSFNEAMTLDGTNAISSISYAPSGMTNLASTLVINVCDDRTAETGRQISLLATGMVSVNSSYACL